MSQIAHEATVVDIAENVLTLELIRTEACNSCAIKNICQQKKNMSVKVDNPQSYTQGQKVNVFIEEKQAATAIFFGYILPLVLILAVLFSILYFFNNEVLAACVSLIIFPLYYLFIYCFNKKLQKVLSARVEQP